MKWSPQQDDALTAVARFMEDPAQQLFYLAGYAGTGKTTLAREFAQGIEGTVEFAAFTGKAAYVLRTKGCPGASTIHSLIYHTKDKGRARLRELENELCMLREELRAENAPGTPLEQIDAYPSVQRLIQLIDEERQALARPMFTLNPESRLKDAKLAIIDECSMVDDRMGEDLLSFGTKVLVLGDPAQLPPVGSGGFFTARDPDFMLTEIHRQAQDNPIIAMATKTRNKEVLDLGTYGDSRVVEGKLDPAEVMAADQILVGRNKTRFSSNRRCRQLKGIEDVLPVTNDRLVCLHNNHDRGLLNGAIWHVHEVGDVEGDHIYLSLTPEDGEVPEPVAVEAHTHYFLSDADDKKLGWWERNDADEFDYGYALTVHKSQGSQWNNVMIFDEAWCFRSDRWKWLYTGITRAADRLTLVRL